VSAGGTLGEHAGELGTRLGRAVSDYSRAAGALESGALAAVPRVHELGAASGDETPVLEPLPPQSRVLTASPNHHRR
jgi:DNA anti-recombination protein RmuC